MTIRVDDPQKSPEGSFITYRVFTMTCLENYSPDNRPVRRRYQDFEWLHDALTLEFPTCIIPPLPEKHRLNYKNRFDPKFIEKRKLSLQWFMDRIARHPYLQASQMTRLFLQSTDFVIKKPDEKFEVMKETIDKFDDNLNIVEKLYHRIGRNQHGLEDQYEKFAGSIRGLSGLERNIDQPLRKFAESTELYAEALKEKRYQEDLLFLNNIHELLNYCHVAKDQLIERDEKQVLFEDLSTDLQSIVNERERILYPGKVFPATTLNMADLMSDKMSDAGRRRNESLLQDSVAKANDENNNYSNQIIKEYEIFQQAKTSELKHGLAAYADCHIDFYRKSLSIWENILPVLDEIQLKDDDDKIKT
ncbi:Phox homologous domain-containing protein [Pilobolus umbonatus]|nr:Phox homologous domain-containing protein [Pilobolus umbonatus]